MWGGTPVQQRLLLIPRSIVETGLVRRGRIGAWVQAFDRAEWSLDLG